MKKSKFPYENAALEILKLAKTDVITTSGASSPFDGDENMDDSWTSSN